MAERDSIMVRQKELRRLHVIHKVLEGEVTQQKAAELLLMSDRQIRRIVQRIRREGDGGIAHRSRGRESSRKSPPGLKEKVILLYRQQYEGFGPTLTAEKLLERDGIEVSKETVHTWLRESGDWQKKRTRRKHRQWRQRKEHCGEIPQRPLRKTTKTKKEGRREAVVPPPDHPWRKSIDQMFERRKLRKRLRKAAA